MVLKRKRSLIIKLKKDVTVVGDTCKMLSKGQYHDLKKDLKSRCRPNIISLCKELELDDYESSLLIGFYSGMSRVDARFKLNICESKYTKDLKIILNKVADYLKRQN